MAIFHYIWLLPRVRNAPETRIKHSFKFVVVSVYTLLYSVSYNGALSQVIEQICLGIPLQDIFIKKLNTVYAIRYISIKNMGDPRLGVTVAEEFSFTVTFSFHIFFPMSKKN